MLRFMATYCLFLAARKLRLKRYAIPLAKLCLLQLDHMCTEAARRGAYVIVEPSQKAVLTKYLQWNHRKIRNPRNRMADYVYLFRHWQFRRYVPRRPGSH